MTKYRVYSLVEAMRLEWGVLSKMEAEVFIWPPSQALPADRSKNGSGLRVPLAPLAVIFRADPGSNLAVG